MSFRLSSRPELLIALLLTTAGCAAGPDYRSPETEVDANWLVSPLASTEETIPDAWWLTLGDALLSQLLSEAAASNRDIGIAIARVDEARGLRAAARAAFWPQVAASGSYTRFEQSIESPSAGGTLIDAGLIPRDVDFYNAGFDASWELDLFGGNRRRQEAANARLGSAVFNQQAVRLSVLAETASAYFELRGAHERLAIAEDNIAAQERSFELTQRKVQSGLARRIDELRAAAQLDALRAQRPALRATIEASRNRLAVLTGRRPEEMSALLTEHAALPVAPRTLTVGMRAEILRRRPDVVAAERDLAAATADIGVARADFFPRLVLNANYGFEAANSADIGDGRARTTALVPFVSWPVFQGGRLRANLAGANARARAAALAYEQAVLGALADAESALSAYAEELRTLDYLRSAASASDQAANISQRLYEQGLTDFLTVLDAERRREEAADRKAQSHTRVLLNMARVYKALGGGWQTEGSD